MQIFLTGSTSKDFDITDIVEKRGLPNQCKGGVPTIRHHSNALIIWLSQKKEGFQPSSKVLKFILFA